MALPNAGVPLSINDIHIEVGGVSGTTASLNDADIRTLVGTSPGTPTSISDYYGTAYNEFAGLIGANDTGDSYLYGYQTLNAGAGTVLGSEGLHTFNYMRTSGKSNVQQYTNNGLNYSVVNGWKRNASGWLNDLDESSGGYNIALRTDWIQSATGFSSSDTQMTIIEYRIYTDNKDTGSGEAYRIAHNGVGMSWGPSNFSTASQRSRMYSFEFGTTDVNRGYLGAGQWSDKNSVALTRTTGRSTLTMITIDTATGAQAAYYSNNGGAVQTALTRTSASSVSNWYLHLAAADEYLASNHPAVFQQTGFQGSLNQGFLYVDRIVSTTELANVSSWLYNNSGVPNHTDETIYTDGTF